ncbi:phage head spike fiber domain-containing protein [Achromobacter marplatensis]|uniref:Uncharacterized protein n=1 Tax=Achromobacter marplatensis TaxID=470868 RepID=A0AA42W9P3_9BURK|nr:hypothetical protein [Achromobacter marplatensis]MDH2051135.1 hypothetical protein [Achromobacter marplatensis]
MNNTTSFGFVTGLRAAEAAVIDLDFRSGDLPSSVVAPTRPGSSATYCDRERMHIAEPDTARVGFCHDTGMWGLVRDYASTNRVAYSQYSPSTWGASTAGAEISVAGAAPFLLDSESFALCRAGSGYVFPGRGTVSTIYPVDGYSVASIFIRPLSAAARPRLLLHNVAFGANQTVTYNPVSDAVEADATNAADTYIGMQKYPNGVRRIFVAAKAVAPTATYPPLMWPTGANGGDFLFGGMQLEWLGYPTSYIPTTGMVVTRLADRGLAAVIDPAMLHATQGTLIADVFHGPSLAADANGFAGLESDDTGTTNTENYSLLACSPGTTAGLADRRIRAYIRSAATPQQAPLAPGAAPSGARVILGSSWDSTTGAMVLAANYDGSVSYSSAVAPKLDVTKFNRMQLGAMYSSANRNMTGFIHRVRYFPRSMAMAELRQEVGL